ncbi:glycerate kinase [uncultured Tessaracoccus sp.]|uniref:glycerate kinase n=1 Tax=uncultured Tessaracoccus sp. TaxID=905023 RepID=UPI0026067523|nr:glycerate kinase [uncultured Tessaracoccus sp.]
MRVLVASGAVGALESHAASVVVARAFQAEGAEVAVVDLEASWPAPSTLDELADVLARGADVVDLRQLEFRLADAERATQAIAGRRFVAVVTDSDVEVPLTGLAGTAVQRSRERGDDLAAGLAADAQTRAWLAALGVDDGAGVGAVDGFGALLLREGVRLTSALELTVERTGFAETATQADLIVTGCTDLDFHTRGGPLVERVVRIAEEALRPVIVVCGRNYVSSRELRLSGIEAAHAVHTGDDPRTVEESDLAALAERVARTWRFE